MPDALRVVPDPNILVSAAIAGGNPQRVVDLAAAGIIHLVTCPRLLAELETVLARDRFLRWRSRDQLTRFVGDIRILAQTVPDPTEVPVVTRDPNDDYLVALVVAADADVLCSGDGDFSNIADVTVLSPAQLIARVLHDT